VAVLLSVAEDRLEQGLVNARAREAQLSKLKPVTVPP
jgi:hypothetical protein